MLLPQSPAFRTLSTRLNAVPTMAFLHSGEGSLSQVWDIVLFGFSIAENIDSTLYNDRVCLIRRTLTKRTLD